MKSNGTGGNGSNGEPIRIALIGCGRISQVHFQVIQREPRARLVAVADTDEKAARGAAEAHGGRAFIDPDEMLSAVQPEAVIICTPPNTHRSIAEAVSRRYAHAKDERRPLPELLVIDGGKPRTLSVGQVTPEGVKLLTATSEAAVVEFGGQRQTLTPGQGTRVVITRWK